MGILFADSSTSVTLEPTWEYENNPIKIEQRKRSLAGNEYVYKFGSYTEFLIPVEFVTSADRDQLYSWWNNNTELTWMEETTATSEYSVKMTDENFPINQKIFANWNLFQGKIKLATY